MGEAWEKLRELGYTELELFVGLVPDGKGEAIWGRFSGPEARTIQTIGPNKSGVGGETLQDVLEEVNEAVEDFHCEMALQFLRDEELRERIAA